MTRYRQPQWQAQMKLQIDYNNMMADYVGPQEGFTRQDIESLAGQLQAAHQRMLAKRSAGEMQWRDLPWQQEAEVRQIIKTAREVRRRCENFVVLGIGGSALGPLAVQTALNHLHYNELPPDKRGGPRFYVLDNIDPERVAALFDIIDPAQTIFNVISKSGSTAETMAQFMIVYQMLRQKLGSGYAAHIIATTDAERGNLIKIARAEGYATFIIPSGVGGRYSELSPVGLLPAAVCGIDIEELLAGAAYMDQLCRTADVFANPAYLLAALQFLAMQRGKNISVMMPYAESLKYFADWYAQLWAESLGKRYNLSGEEVFTGQTPVKALGATDQHSQVQLYTEGPFDKVVTFLKAGSFRAEVDIPRVFKHVSGLAFLGGHTLGELLTAEQLATEYALMKAARLSFTITLPEINPFTVGQLIQLLAVKTAFAGELLHINAFDQPGVEEGKNATYALLGRPGYEAKKEELAARPAKNPAYII
ncbi:glucose-6-phosphate isomerase [Desulforamulus hydrothermalis]|uniref:Glucose-6-phosphate isomerase n=1 Tax=Desulforamulus hydrothermalis Lam5 = DSM 18033 TaxID=1121428 RepID=K8DYV6_9FIRM|nr:glucose-6-phosphate isomerase [Desulforamulus hydrothermalis]CCO08094.1 Glucose-6-phosphate isomerase [Desulforamulus hydrothermalis Lam5 = DSM 18033]SHG82150.1 glucose-6-phosphate isomerase [Desulforamulus hydrothermalis Lam5 = DSM 18033]